MMNEVVIVVCTIINICIAFYWANRFQENKKIIKECEKFYNQKIERELEFIKSKIELRRNANHTSYVLAEDDEEARYFFEALRFEDEMILHFFDESGDLK